MTMLYICCLALIVGKRGIPLIGASPNCGTAIKRDLENGITLVVDRYIYSGIAFSAAKVVGT